MESFPAALVSCIELFRPLFWAEVFASFGSLIAGMLIGEAKYGTVRASVFAGADSWPRRLSDVSCRHKLSHQACMAARVEVALAARSPTGLPGRLFWIADSTHTEKPYATRIASLGLFHRTTRLAGRTQHLQGHGDGFAAHLFTHTAAQPPKWVSVLVGALVYVKGRSIPALVGTLAKHLRLPAAVRHVWLVDRGILSRPLRRVLGEVGHLVLGRVRGNQVVYFAPAVGAVPPATRQRRPRVYGQKCRIEQWRTQCADRLREQTMVLRVRGRERSVKLWEAAILWRGVWRGRALPVWVLIIAVPGLKLKPWYLPTPDRDLEPREAVRASDGRDHIEVNMDAVKELGWGHSQGRSGQGVRRWPLLLCLGQMILKCMATAVLPVQLPALHWSWYAHENTVGQVRWRLIEACGPRISRVKANGRSSRN